MVSLVQQAALAWSVAGYVLTVLPGLVSPLQEQLCQSQAVLPHGLLVRSLHSDYRSGGDQEECVDKAI